MKPSRDFPKEEKPYHHGDLRTSLIDAGLAILQEDGCSAVGFREVARRVGVSSAAPYRHFSSRDGFMAVLAEKGFEYLRSQQMDAINAEPDHPVAQLKAQCRNYVAFALAHGSWFRVMFGGYLARNEVPESFVSAGNELFGLLVDNVVACQRLGCVREGDPDQMGITIWALVHGLAMIQLDGNALPVAHQLSEKHLVDWVMHPLWCGLNGAASASEFVSRT